jgi:hypothetical protein
MLFSMGSSTLGIDEPFSAAEIFCTSAFPPKRTFMRRPIWGWILLVFFSCGTALGEKLPALTKSVRAVAQKIPLVMYEPDSGKMTLSWVKLRWDNMAGAAEGNDALQFEFDHQGEDILFNSFRSQLWISALASGMAWQQPWLAAKWTVTEIPPGDASGSGAALGVAFIATASRTAYPSTTAVLGRLNPDGSLGLVFHLAARVEAAAAAGMKRVIIPNLQRFEVNEQGEVLNIPALAEKLGLECVVVDDLIEATEIVLRKKLPQAFDLPNSPRYSAKLFGLLDAKVRVELHILNTQAKSWPRAHAQFAALSGPEQNLWRKVFQNYDMGIGAYQAGQLYAARQLMRQAHAYARSLSEKKDRASKFDYNAFDLRADTLREKMLSRINQPVIDKNELQSALVLAEENDWIYGLNSSVQGAQIMARQAFGARSNATPQQQLLAQTLFVSAVRSGEYQMEDKSFYTECYQLIAPQGEISVYNRASIIWPQLLPAQLGRADFFIVGLKSRANELGESLLFDARLSSFVRGLRNSKIAWEQQQKETERRVPSEKPAAADVGFVPGPGYLPPKIPVPPLPISSLSDAARCLSWVNEYCDVAVLEQKYLHLGGSFDATTLEWRVRNRVALENMLQFADLGARRGIVLAESVGADSSILSLIYEVGSNLRASEDNNLRLEGLRQYWRCALLGSMCWQLSFSPRAALHIPETPPMPPSPPPPAAAVASPHRTTEMEMPAKAPVLP